MNELHENVSVSSTTYILFNALHAGKVRICLLSASVFVVFQNKRLSKNCLRCVCLIGASENLDPDRLT